MLNCCFPSQSLNNNTHEIDVVLNTCICLSEMKACLKSLRVYKITICPPQKNRYTFNVK